MRKIRSEMRFRIGQKAALKRRCDADILSNIWSKLWYEDTIRLLDIYHIEVRVDQGEARLRGHVSRDSNKRFIAQIITGVPGVVSVVNQLVTDRELEIEVAHALASDERTKPFKICVGSIHGWIHLYGYVPSLGDCVGVEEVVASVPEVRGVIGLPETRDHRKVEIQRKLQPSIDATVYGECGKFGSVKMAVIDPRNRLASHIIVRVRCDVDGRRSHKDYVVPVDLIASAKSGSVFLAPKIKPDSLAAFKPNNFPPPPHTWRPPFPYERKDVRWSAQFNVPLGLPIILSEEQPNTSHAIKAQTLQMTDGKKEA